MDSNENTSTIYYDGTYSAELSTYVIDSVSAAGQIVVSTDSNHFTGILPPTQTIDTANQLMLVYNNNSTATSISDSFEWIPTQAGQIRFSKGWQILTSSQNGNFLYVDPPATTNTISYLVYKQGGVGIGWTDVVNNFPFVVDTKCQLLSYDAVKNTPTVTTGTMTNHVLQTTNSNNTGLTFGYITPSNMNINPLDIAQGYSLLTINPDNTFGLSRNFGYSQEIEPGQIAYLEDTDGQYLLSGIEAPSASDLLLVTYLNDENKIRWQYMSFSSVSGIATPSLPDMLLVTSTVGSTTVWTYQSFSTVSGIPDPDTASGFLVASNDAWVITPTSTATGIDNPSIQGNLLLANAATSRWESVSPSTATGIPDPIIPGNLLMISSDNTWISVDRNTATGLPTTSVSGQIIVSDGSNGWQISDVAAVTGVPFPEKDGTLLTATDGKWSETTVSTAINIDDPTTTGYLLRAQNGRWRSTPVSDATLVASPVNNVGNLLVSNGATWIAQNILQATRVSYPENGRILQGYVQDGKSIWATRDVSSVTYVNFPTKADTVLISTYLTSENRYQWTEHTKADVLSPFLDLNPADDQVLVGNDGRWVSSGINDITGLPPPNENDQLEVLVSLNGEWSLSNMNEVTNIPLHPSAQYQLLGSNATTSSWQIMDVTDAINLEYTSQDRRALMSSDGGWIAVERSILTGVPEADVEDNIMYVSNDGRWITGPSYLVTGLSLPVNINTIPIATNGSWKETILDTALSTYIDKAITNTDTLLQADGSMWKATVVSSAISIADAIDGYILFGSFEEDSGINTPATGKLTWKAYNPAIVTGIPKPISDKTILQSNGASWQETVVSTAISIDDGVLPGTILQANGSAWKATAINTALSSYISLASASDGMLLQSDGSTWKATAVNTALSSYITVADISNEAYFLKSAEINGSYSWQAQPFSTATGIPDPDSTQLFILATDTTNGGWCLMNPYVTTGLPNPKPGHLLIGVAADGSNSNDHWVTSAVSDITGITWPSQTASILQSNGVSWQETVVSTAISIDNSVLPGTILQANNNRWKATAVNTALSSYITIADVSNKGTLLQSDGSTWKATAVNTALSDYITVANVSNEAYFLKSAEMNGSYSWQAQPFSTATGIPDPTISNMVLASTGSGWMLTDPTSASGLPTSTPEKDQILVSSKKPGEDAYVWTNMNISTAISIDTAVTSTTGMLLQSNGTTWNATSISTAIRIPDATMSDQNMILVSNNNIHGNSTVTSWTKKNIAEAISIAYAITNNDLLVAKNGSWVSKSVPEATGLPELNSAALAGQILSVDDTGMSWVLADLKASSGLPSGNVERNKIMASGSSTGWSILDPNIALSSYISVANGPNNGYILQSNGTMWNATAVNTALASYISLANGPNNGYILQSNGTNWTAKDVSTVTGISVSPESNNTFLVSDGGKWIESAVTATLLSPVIDPPTTDDRLLVSDATTTKWVAKSIAEATGLPELNDMVTPGYVIAVNQSKDGWILVNMNESTGMPSTAPSVNQLMVGVLDSSGSAIWGIRNQPDALSSYISIASANNGKILQSNGTNWTAMDVNMVLSPYISLANGTNNGKILQSNGTNWTAKEVSTVTGVPTSPGSDNNTILVSNGGKWTESAVTTTLLSPVIDPPITDDTLLVSNTIDSRWEAMDVFTATGLPNYSIDPKNAGKVIAVNGDNDGWTLIDLNATTGMPTTLPTPGQLMVGRSDAEGINYWSVENPTTALSPYIANASTIDSGCVLVSNGSNWSAMEINEALTPYISLANANNRKILQSDGGSWVAKDVSTVTGIPTSPESNNNTLLVSNGGKWIESAVTATLLSPVIDPPRANTLLAPNATTTKWVAKSIAEATGLPDITSSGDQNGKVLGVQGDTWTLVDLNDSTGIPAGNPGTNMIMASGNSTSWQALNIPTALSSYISVANANNGKILQSNGTNWTAKEVSTVTGIPTTPESDNNTILVSNGGKWTESAVTATLLSSIIEIPTDSNMVLLSTTNSSWTAVESLNWTIVGLPEGSAEDANKILRYEIIDGQPRWSLVSITDSSGLPANAPNVNDILIGQQDNESVTWQLQQLNTALTYYIDAPPPGDNDNSTRSILVSDNSRWTSMVISTAIGIPDPTSTNEMIISMYTDGKYVWSKSNTATALSSYIPLASANNEKILQSDGTNWVAKTVSTVTGIPTTPGSDNNTILVSNDGTWTESAVTATLLSPVIGIPNTSNKVLLSNTGSSWAAVESLPASVTGLPAVSSTDQGCVLTVSTEGKWSVVDPSTSGSTGFLPTPSTNNKSILVATNKSWTITSNIASVTGVPTTPESDNNTILVSNGGTWTESAVTATLLSPVIEIPTNSNMVLLSTTNSSWNAVVSLPASVTGLPTPNNSSDILVSNGSSWVTSSVSTVTGIPTTPESDNNTILVSNDGKWIESAVTTTLLSPAIDPPRANTLLAPNATTTKWEATDIFTATGLPNYSVDPKNAGKVIAVNGDNDGWTLIDLNATTGMPTVAPEVGQLMVGRSSPEGTNYWNVENPSLALSPYIATASTVTGQILISNGTNWIALPSTDTNSLLIGNNDGSWTTGFIEDILPGTNNQLLQFNDDHWEAVTSIDWTIVGLPEGTSSDYSKFLQYTATGWELVAVNDETGIPSTPPETYQLMASGNSTSWKNLDIKDALTPYIPLANGSNNGLILQSDGSSWIAKAVSTVTGIAPPTTTNQILVSSNGSNWSPGMITASLLSNVIDIPSENKVLLGTKNRWTAVTSLSSSITGLPIATDSDQVIVSTDAGNWDIKNVNELVTPIAAPTASSRLLFSVNGTPDYQWQETTVPVVLNDYIPNVSTTSDINGKLLVADTSTSKWNAMAFSDVSGIPNPDSSNSGKLLGIGGDGWSLIDPSIATGLPMATAEGQIIVAKSVDESVVWTTTLYTNSSPNTTTSYLIGNNGVQLFTKSYLFEKSESSVEISNGGNSYTYSVYDNADGLLFAHGILHYRFEVIVDPSATPNSNYTNIKINESTTISYSIPSYAAIVVVDGAYDLTTNTTLKSIAFNTDAMVCFKINSWYVEVIEAM